MSKWRRVWPQCGVFGGELKYKTHRSLSTTPPARPARPKRNEAAVLRLKTELRRRAFEESMQSLVRACPRPWYHEGSYDTPNVRLSPASDVGAAIEGYACAWDQLSRPLHGCGMREVVRRGAFDAALQSGNTIRLLVGHDETICLDDTDHSLRVWADDYGLRFSAQPAMFCEQTWANVLPLMSEGLNGVSPALGAGSVEDITHVCYSIREIVRVDTLREISCCFDPSWPGTLAKAFDRFARHRSRLQTAEMLDRVRKSGWGRGG